MKVRDLIAKLTDHDMEAEVVIGSTEREVDIVDTGLYGPTWHNKVELELSEKVVCTRDIEEYETNRLSGRQLGVER